MQQYQLSIKANYRNGILERILRAVRHRGGFIVSMQMNQIENNHLDLELNLADSDEKVALSKHLSKINDVLSVNLV